MVGLAWTGMNADAGIESLTTAELDALRGAAAWYAKYHHAKIEEALDDPAAYAVVRRERYVDLVAALRKLGFDMALPDALAARLRAGQDAAGRSLMRPASAQR